MGTPWGSPRWGSPDGSPAPTRGSAELRGIRASSQGGHVKDVALQGIADGLAKVPLASLDPGPWTVKQVPSNHRGAPTSKHASQRMGKFTFCGLSQGNMMYQGPIEIRNAPCYCAG